MKQIVVLLLVLLVLPMQAMAVNVQSMIDELPMVEEFRAMDNQAQNEAYSKTQAAYDAYMALSAEEKARVEGAEETFEALFGYFNTLVTPAEEPVQEAESSSASNLVSTILAALVGIFLAKKLVTKRKL